ncbi:MAG: CapA family protein, partial [Acidobacteriaceae bacterium]|nr:CapA family protein [Acidobacteriaceae bacterium]
MPFGSSTKLLPPKFSLAAAAAFLACIGCSTPPVAPPEIARKALARPGPSGYNRLIFAGDVMLSRGVRKAIVAACDSALPFRKIAPLTSAADIAFVNLESPFSDTGPYHEGGLVFHAAPEMISGLQLAGIAIASTANNHSRDCGSHGVDYTISWLRSHGISPVGSSESEQATHGGVILERHGIRFGFLGYTYDQQNGNWRDIDRRIAIADPAVVAHD